MSENLNLIDTITEFNEDKQIDKETLMRILEDIFKQMLYKKYGPEAKVNVIVNADKGDVEFQLAKDIVEDDQVINPNTQIALSDAIKIEPDFEVGEEVYEFIYLKDFGRRDILSLRQNLAAKITEFEKDKIYQMYEDRIGEIVSGTVTHFFKRDIIFVDNQNTEILIRKNDLIPRDFYKKGDPIRAVITKVEPKANNTLIEASRTDPVFLERLMEEDIPEIADGIIVVKEIVRRPGERAKVLVETFDDRIDPVGSCVGMKGSRIHGIMRELREESIDIVNYTSNIDLLIARALNPAKISKLEINKEQHTAVAKMGADQISLAIGKNGVNISLASKLTGYKIDVVRDNTEEIEDVDIQDFSDEIEPWILDILKSIGCDSGRSVLKLTREELIRRTDLEEETIDEVIRVISNEFEL